ncbi:MAG: PhnD/SsuA/transferrin family substrate-binding protein [Bryobacterales bacterium]|nr:PhnD/SsuA/transferrin family substrate-binding protein [Bryobacterales bacterium]
MSDLRSDAGLGARLSRLDVWRHLIVAGLMLGTGFFAGARVSAAQGQGAMRGRALAASGVPADTALGHLRPTRLNAVISSRMFTSVNRNDAVAAVKAWLELVGKERGFALDTRVDVISNTPELRQRLEARSVDVLILDSVEFLQIEGTGLLVPRLLGSRSKGERASYSYLVLVPPSSPAEKLSDLKGARISHFSRSQLKTSLAWLDVTLAKERLGRAATYFGDSRFATKPQDCVLPLFFNRLDACVVDEINFEIMREMNPQLGKLRVVLRSPPLVEALIATPANQHPYHGELMEAILALHESVRGRQLLMVFNTGRLVRFTPGDLRAVRSLWAEYHQLTGDPGDSAETENRRVRAAGVAERNPQ